MCCRVKLSYSFLVGRHGPSRRARSGRSKLQSNPVSCFVFITGPHRPPRARGCGGALWGPGVFSHGPKAPKAARGVAGVAAGEVEHDHVRAAVRGQGDPTRERRPVHNEQNRLCKFAERLWETWPLTRRRERWRRRGTAAAAPLCPAAASRGWRLAGAPHEQRGRTPIARG